jgi:hypothetical protein
VFAQRNDSRPARSGKRPDGFRNAWCAGLDQEGTDMARILDISRTEHTKTNPTKSGTPRPRAPSVPRSPPSSRKPTATPIDAEAIRNRAYEIYLARRGEPGNAVLDWLQAETELQHERARGRGA